MSFAPYDAYCGIWPLLCTPLDKHFSADFHKACYLDPDCIDSFNLLVAHQVVRLDFLNLLH